jgi:hypothetical protein
VKLILFLLMLIMIAGSGIVYVANGMVGYDWAEQVCGFYNVCDHFYWLLAATVIGTVGFSRCVGVRHGASCLLEGLSKAVSHLLFTTWTRSVS